MYYDRNLPSAVNCEDIRQDFEESAVFGLRKVLFLQLN